MLLQVVFNSLGPQRRIKETSCCFKLYSTASHSLRGATRKLHVASSCIQQPRASEAHQGNFMSLQVVFNSLGPQRRIKETSCCFKLYSTASHSLRGATRKLHVASSCIQQPRASEAHQANFMLLQVVFNSLGPQRRIKETSCCFKLYSTASHSLRGATRKLHVASSCIQQPHIASEAQQGNFMLLQVVFNSLT